MQKLILTAVASLFCASLALAQTPAPAAGDKKPAAAAEKKLTPQQERMKSCNAEAKDKKLKGAERKSFMKECLGGKTAAAAPATKGMAQQEKMKSCNAEAKDKNLKGAERKKFMSECLKG